MTRRMRCDAQLEPRQENAGPVRSGTRARSSARACPFRRAEDARGFDWDFNAKTSKRVETEQLASCDFVRRRENCVFAGQSGIGKSHIMQAIGARACALDTAAAG